MNEFHVTFRQHQHPQWARFYIDIDALSSTAENPIDGAAARQLAPRLREECDKALTFVQGRLRELRESVGSMEQELASISTAERTAKVEPNSFINERKAVRQRAWEAWAAADQLAAFASLNCEAAARLGHEQGAELRDDASDPVQQLLSTEAVALVPLKKQLRDFVAANWYGGDKNSAIEFLCHVDREDAKPADYFFAGLTVGVTLCFAGTVGHVLTGGELSWSPHFMFYTYRPAFSLALACWMWGLNIYIFETFGVNHVFILQTSGNAERYLKPAQVVWVAGTWTVLLLAALWLQASNYVLRYSELLRELPPVLVWVVVLAVFFMPGERFYGSSRHMLQKTLGRVLCAGLFPVIFRDVMMGDILTSLGKPMNDLGHLSCYFYSEIGGLVPLPIEEVNETAWALADTDECGCAVGTGWSLEKGGCRAADALRWGQPQEEEACHLLLIKQNRLGASGLTLDDVEQHCTRYNPWLDTLFAMLPYAIRLVQCVRRHVDAARKNGGKGFFHAPTQLYNACKYASCILVSTLSWLDHVWVSDRVDRHVVPPGYASWSDVPVTEVTVRPLRFAWLCSVIFATCFKLYWDVVHDFGFTLKFWELRPKKLYPDPVYFFVLGANLLLRLSWTITISPGFFGVDHLGKQSGLWLSTFITIGEVCRRFLWTLVRIESEHAKTHKLPTLEDDSESATTATPGDADRSRRARSQTTGDHSDEILVAVPSPNLQPWDEYAPQTLLHTTQISIMNSVGCGVVAARLDRRPSPWTPSRSWAILRHTVATSRSLSPVRNQRGSDASLRSSTPVSGSRSRTPPRTQKNPPAVTESVATSYNTSREPPPLPRERRASGAQIKQRAVKWDSQP